MVKKISVVFLILASFVLMFLSERPLYFALPFWGLLVALCYSDYKSMKLPNILTGAVLVLGVFFNIQTASGILMPLISFSIALFSLLGLSYFYHKVRGRHGLGMGDVKLFAAGAVWLNPYLLPFVMLLSSVGALIYVALFWRGEITTHMNRKIPFGPFLSLALWLTWLFEEKFMYFTY